jgi:hypothetical protein
MDEKGKALSRLPIYMIAPASLYFQEILRFVLILRASE